MNFVIFEPDKRLKPYVKNLWYAEHASSGSIDVLADGLHGIIFQTSEEGIFIEQTNKKLSNTFLSGQTVAPFTIQAHGPFRMAGALLYPYITKPIFGFDLYEITNSCLDLSLMMDNEIKHLTEKLINATSAQNHIDLLSAYLVQVVEMNKLNINNKIRSAFNQIFCSHGGISLRALQENLNLTERTFERMFDQHIGISPKLFSRVCQFYSSYNQFKAGDFNKLSDIANDNGYADQSHFIRSFKKFAGYSPLEFQRLPQQPIESMPVLLK